MALTIDAPSAAMGEISGDLAARRGRIQDTRTEGERLEIRALAPMTELGDYATRLKAMTGGEALYTLEFSHYDYAPENLQQQLAADYRPREEEG